MVTRANNRQPIEAELEKRPIPGLFIHYLDLWRPLQAVKRRSGTIGLIIYYYFWQLALWKKARDLHASHPFDIVHHVTFANDWLPSGLALTGLPFVWGPIGGSSHRVPSGFSSSWSARARAYEALRATIQGTFLHLDPLLRWTRRSALVALPYTREAAEVLPDALRNRSQVVVHIGVEPVSDHSRARPGLGQSIRLVTGGRLVHWKGFDLLIEALALNHLEGSLTELLVTGDGPERQSLERLVREHGLESAVQFTGRLPHVSDVYSALIKADVYALLTLRDGPPVAMLEAMHAGLPILYLDLGAPAELVPRDAGFGIQIGTREETIVRVAEALRKIESDPGKLSSMGELAHRYAAQVYSWEAVGRQIESIYDQIDPYPSE